MANTLQISPLEGSERFAIVVAEWNKAITGKLLDGAIETFSTSGIPSENLDVAWVPGSWELPVVTRRLARNAEYSAILALGAVIRGETSHDQHINRSVSLALMDIGLTEDLPVLFGLLTCESMEQAIQRAGGNVGNKGSECAEAAVKMVGLLKNCHGR